MPATPGRAPPPNTLASYRNGAAPPARRSRTAETGLHRSSPHRARPAQPRSASDAATIFGSAAAPQAKITASASKTSPPSNSTPPTASVPSRARRTCATRVAFRNSTPAPSSRARQVVKIRDGGTFGHRTSKSAWCMRT